MSIGFLKFFKYFFFGKRPAVPKHGRRISVRYRSNYTSSMTAISAASPRRAPVRVTLV